jgi:hypothetical protein
MSDLKRRPLGSNQQQNNQQQQRPQAPRQNQGQPQNQTQGQGQGQSQNPSQGNNNPNQRQRQPQRNNNNNPQRQNQNPNQRNNRPNQGPSNHRPVQRQRPPPPPPAYMQRDILLIANAETTTGIAEVRNKLDPLAKKIPAHVTLISPEPSKAISAELLKSAVKENLPSLASLNFNQVIIHDDMYLWLLPDEESKLKIIEWRNALLGQLTTLNPEHTQGSEEFLPHITLGYIPRSLSPEDAVTFAKTSISLPLSISFEKFLLEEFAENQVSTQVDALAIR